MAKEDKESHVAEPGAEEIAELSFIAENAIPNRLELVTITSKKTGIVVTVSRDQVFRYASVMASNTQIADLTGIEPETLAKYFSRELKIGRAFARQKLITRCYNLALFGNNPADRIFALKNWTNMSDQGLKEELEDVEAGAAFGIRRPQKPVEHASLLSQREAAYDLPQVKKDLAEQARIIEDNASD